MPLYRSSLSRGTWIEIGNVADMAIRASSRPSHEGRGLKWLPFPHFAFVVGRPSHEGRGSFFL